MDTAAAAAAAAGDDEAVIADVRQFATASVFVRDTAVFAASADFEAHNPEVRRSEPKRQLQTHNLMPCVQHEE